MINSVIIIIKITMIINLLQLPRTYNDNSGNKNTEN